MRLVRGLINLPEKVAPCALTIGNFDGVHLGHQEILRSLSEVAEERDLASSLMVFEPQPMEFFRRDNAPARLYRFIDKLKILNELTLDQVIVMDFNRHLADMQAEDFIRRVLIDRLNVKYLLIGDDFRFGKDRAGDFQMLQQASDELGFELHSIDSVLEAERRVSSTAIRVVLESGDLESAEQLLGRPYHMSGRVVHGKKLGRDIGWPTINIPVRRQHSPLAGIYAVRVRGVEEGKILNGVASIGTRPTVGGEGWILEVNLFSWSGDCYGRRVEVEFVQHLRDELKFDSIEAMTAQIQRDANEAREVLRA